MRRITTEISSCITPALLVLALGFVPQLRADDKATGGRSRLAIESKTYDFGAVPEGSKVIHDFEVKNLGTMPLQIQRIIPACGCTASNVDKDSVDPGSSAKIHIEFDTTGFSGEKVKTVRVLTSDPDVSSLDLTIKGTVDRELTIEPARVSFDEVALGALEQSTKSVSIRLREGSESAISAVKSVSKNVVVTQKQSGPKARTVDVTLTKNIAIGEFRDRLVVEVAGPKGVRSYTIPIYAQVTGDVRLRPSSLSFGVLDTKSETERSTRLENLGNKGITLKEIKSDNPAVSASSVAIEAGKRFVVKVKVRASQLSSRKDLKAQLTVITDAGDFPLVVYGIMPDARSVS